VFDGDTKLCIQTWRHDKAKIERRCFSQRDHNFEVKHPAKHVSNSWDERRIALLCQVPRPQSSSRPMIDEHEGRSHPYSMGIYPLVPGLVVVRSPLSLLMRP